jgi:hypothetical protein
MKEVKVPILYVKSFRSVLTFHAVRAYLVMADPCYPVSFRRGRTW